MKYRIIEGKIGYRIPCTQGGVSADRTDAFSSPLNQFTVTKAVIYDECDLLVSIGVWSIFKVSSLHWPYVMFANTIVEKLRNET